MFSVLHRWVAGLGGALIITPGLNAATSKPEPVPLAGTIQYQHLSAKSFRAYRWRVNEGADAYQNAQIVAQVIEPQITPT